MMRYRIVCASCHYYTVRTWHCPTVRGRDASAEERFFALTLDAFCEIGFGLPWNTMEDDAVAHARIKLARRVGPGRQACRRPCARVDRGVDESMPFS